MINSCLSELLLKKITFFSSQSIRMSGNSINFNDKKIFYKNKEIFDINDIDVNKSLKKKNMVNMIHLNTLLGIMIMMLLNHYF